MYYLFHEEIYLPSNLLGVEIYQKDQEINGIESLGISDGFL